MTRSIVKTNYVKLGGPEGAGARGRVKASANYYGHRPNEEGQREWRDAFSGAQDRMSKEEAYEQVSEAEGEYAYRIVLSPGREMDEGDLMEWTRDIMALGAERGWFGEELELRYALERDPEVGSEDEAERWLAWAHTDHTDNPHVHVLAFTNRALHAGDFAKMRQEGDLAAEETLDSREEMEEGRTPYRGRDWGPRDDDITYTSRFHMMLWGWEDGYPFKQQEVEKASASQDEGWSPIPTWRTLSREEERKQREEEDQLLQATIMEDLDDESDKHHYPTLLPGGYEEAVQEEEEAAEERDRQEYEEGQGW